MLKDRLLDCTPAERQAILTALREAMEAERRVLFAYVHGSFTERRPFHDIDVAVYLDLADPQAMRVFALQLAADLERALSRLFDQYLPLDIRVLNHAPLGFRYHALWGTLLLSRDDDLLAQILAQTASRYLDLKPLWQQALKEAMSA